MNKSWRLWMALISSFFRIGQEICCLFRWFLKNSNDYSHYFIALIWRVSNEWNFQVFAWILRDGFFFFWTLLLQRELQIGPFILKLSPKCLCIIESRITASTQLGFSFFVWYVVWNSRKASWSSTIFYKWFSHSVTKQNSIYL